ncbi:Tfp pilus assembly protein FimT/FimU [Acidiferrobacter sp.]|uniref:pilus assembly FimT family protein n=1 Tax=Acidiferrobacter sp. TaxID=1872107 RepID=UPI00262A7D3F|nr:prepilin-type N-terminal cleavage/methylation domain-containing protein [Acidiferrobacter sp.]
MFLSHGSNRAFGPSWARARWRGPTGLGARALRVSPSRESVAQVVAERRASRRLRQYGFTVVELMVVIAVVAIATAVALPDLSTWLVNSRIQQAAGDLQENMQWGRAYALKTDQEVDFNLTAGGNHGCSWSMSLPVANSNIQGAPSMAITSGSTPLFSQRYPGISCTVGAGAVFPITFMPSGTVWAAGSPANGYVAFAANSDASKFVTWLVKYYGAGELRSCITAPASAATPVGTCVNQ